MAEKTKSIYAKLAEARAAFHKLDLKKSGENKFAGYKYFELGDFVQPGLNCMAEAGICPVVTFEPEKAVMRLYELDGDGCIEIESPRATANLKGCHPIQNLGAEETYQRRYLWMAALEVVEHDAVDAMKPDAVAEKISESTVADIEAKMQEVGFKGGFVACQCGGNLVLRRNVRRNLTLESVRCSGCGRWEPRSLRDGDEIIERGRKAAQAFVEAQK